ncbi:MAG: hypothetical protein ABI690_35285 [Chloroflexota bacterium]
MPLVFAVHEFELKVRESAEAFEQLIAANGLPSVSGYTITIVKGNRGERAGKYALIHEFDSLEARDRCWPSGSEQPADVRAMIDEIHRLTAALTPIVNTDYIALV